MRHTDSKLWKFHQYSRRQYRLFPRGGSQIVPPAGVPVGGGGGGGGSQFVLRAGVPLGGGQISPVFGVATTATIRLMAHIESTEMITVVTIFNLICWCIATLKKLQIYLFLMTSFVYFLCACHLISWHAHSVWSCYNTHYTADGTYRKY